MSNTSRRFAAGKQLALLLSICLITLSTHLILYNIQFNNAPSVLSNAVISSQRDPPESASVALIPNPVSDSPPARASHTRQLSTSLASSVSSRLAQSHQKTHSNTVSLPAMQSNCSADWRDSHHIFYTNAELLALPKYVDAKKNRYIFRKMLKGTFTWWLSHIESQHSLASKAFFADKYLVKTYIDELKTTQPQFSRIKRAPVLRVLSSQNKTSHISTQEKPTPDEILALKAKHKAFVVKPNHFSGKQLIFTADDEITPENYSTIIRVARVWSKKTYTKNAQGHVDREPWYSLMEPVVFIEQHLNPERHRMIEYKFFVFNHRALFLYVNSNDDSLNLYLLPKFELLNVTWAYPPNAELKLPAPKKKNLELMLRFSEWFARTENFRFVRVDLYELDGEVYFSEFTFAPGDGTGVLLPVTFDYLLYNVLCENGDEGRIRELQEYLF